ncbi:MAG: CHAD domain-containing protein [Pseudomonadota bacterium]
MGRPFHYQPALLTLHLLGPTADISALAQLVCARDGAGSAEGEDARLTAKRPWRRICVTAYDTPDGELRAKRRALEVARADGGVKVRLASWAEDGWRCEERHLPTSAIPGANGAHGAAVRPLQIDREARANGFAPGFSTNDKALAPLATLHADEALNVIIVNDAVIEMTLMVGRVESEAADALTTSFGCARVRLLRGSVETFFDWVRNAVLASRPGLRTGLGEGAHWRCSGSSFELPRARKVRIDREADAGDALAEGLAAGAARLSEIRPYLLASRDPEAARQARVALRRLRTFERLFREVVGGAGVRRLSRRARRLARIIGAARDWEVFLNGTLVEFDPDCFEPKGAAKLRAAAARARDVAWEEVHRAVAAPSYEYLVLDGLREAVTQGWRDGAAQELTADVGTFAGRALDASLADAVCVADRMQPGDEAGLHDLRLALKRFRYAAQAFRELYPKDARRPYFEALSALQEKLGALNDAVVAQDLAMRAAKGQGRAAARAAGYVCGRAAERGRQAAAAAWADWRALVDAPRYWREETDAMPVLSLKDAGETLPLDQEEC